MFKNKNELEKILKQLLQNPENECVEFKRAEKSFDIDKLGKYFSAISNEATISNRQYGWVIFGVNDKDHSLINTVFCNDNNFNNIKIEISKNTTDNISFIDIYPLMINGKRVIMFQVPAAMGIPTSWKGFPYGRNGESLVPLNQLKIEQIKATANYDWTRQIIENASIDDLDKNAINKAREQFKLKHSGETVADEIDNLSDLDFLNKAKVTLDGKITKAAMLLLGNYDKDYLIDDYNPRMTWRLCDEKNVIDYEHFGIPYIINIDKLKNKVRNLKYRYMVNDNSLFPNEVDQYDSYILRELLNNCIVHQDYRLKGIIVLTEYKDKLEIINEGSFIPIKVENVLKDGYSSPYYRNPFLASAMVNLNMIDTVGSGIKRVFNVQKERFFPMPDYDTQNNRVKVTLFGKILDEKYSKILFEKSDLDISQVILLDRVQKGYMITRQESDFLRKSNLIEGRYPNIFVSYKIAELTNKKTDYIYNKGLENDYYENLILQYISKYGRASRKEIIELLRNKLPDSLDDSSKINKTRYLLDKLKNEGKIYNDGTKGISNWKIKEKN